MRHENKATAAHWGKAKHGETNMLHTYSQNRGLTIFEYVRKTQFFEHSKNFSRKFSNSYQNHSNSFSNESLEQKYTLRPLSIQAYFVCGSLCHWCYCWTTRMRHSAQGTCEARFSVDADGRTLEDSSALYVVLKVFEVSCVRSISKRFFGAFAISDCL